MEHEKRQNLLNSHIESKEIKAIRRIMDQSSSLHNLISPPPHYSVHWTFFGCYHLVLLYYNIFRTRTHAHTLTSWRGRIKVFPFCDTFRCTFIYCVFIYYIICFGIRVFLEVTKSMSENGIKNHQAPNTKMTERATAEGEFARREVGVGGSYKCKREEEKCVYSGKTFCFFQEWASTRAIASWLFYHHIHTRICFRIHIHKIHTFSVNENCAGWHITANWRAHNT